MRSVLYVTTSTAIGGAEKTLFHLAGGLDPKRYQASAVVCLKPKGLYAERLERSGLPVESLGLGRLPGPRALSKLRGIIEDRKPDLVHAFLYTAIQLCRGAKLLGRARVRLVSSPRVTYRTRPKPLLAVDALLKGQDDLLIAESKASAAFFTQNLGYRPEKVSAILNGLDLSRHVFSEVQRRERRAELGLSDADFLIGSVGRLDPQKGQRIFLRALALLPARCKGLLIGDGPDRLELEEQAAQLGLGGRIRFLGAQSDAQPWLSALDLYAQPSLWEGTPNAVMEAMATGLPVVASRVDGIEEIVDDYRSGLLVAPNDPWALAAAVRALSEAPREARALGEKARGHAFEHFALPRMIDEYQAAYDGLFP